MEFQSINLVDTMDMKLVELSVVDGGLLWRSFIHVSTLAQEGVALQRGSTAPSLDTPLIAQLLAALQVL